MTVAQKCPVCEGKGKMPPGFYPDGASGQWIDCRSCSGRGIVFGYQTDAPVYVPVPSVTPYRPWIPNVYPTSPYTWTVTSTTNTQPAMYGISGNDEAVIVS